MTSDCVLGGKPSQSFFSLEPLIYNRPNWELLLQINSISKNRNKKQKNKSPNKKQARK